MRDFDFLEYELESLEGESVDNFNWGVRRPSLTNLEGELIGGVEREARHSAKQMRPEGESSDEELGSVSPVDDLSARSGGDHSGASSSVSTTSSGVFPPSSLPGLVGRGRSRSLTPNSETESGECSDGEMSDLTPCNASPSLSALLGWGACRRVERNDVEESWRQHVQTLMTSSSQANLLHTFALFGRLFRDLRTKTVGLTEDSCGFLIRDGSTFSQQLRGAVSQFERLLAVLAGVPECPHVWCDFTLLCNPHLTERIKFNVLEIQENFDNYVDKKETTLSCLEGLKAHAKLIALGESLDSCTNLEADQVELCRFLYKLHFQQLLLLESYTKLLQLLSGAAASSGVADRSSEVASVRVALLAALSDTLTPPGSPAQGRTSSRTGSVGEEGSSGGEEERGGGDSPTPKVTSPSSDGEKGVEDRVEKVKEEVEEEVEKEDEGIETDGEGSTSRRSTSPTGDSPTPRLGSPAGEEGDEKEEEGEPTPTPGSEGEEEGGEQMSSRARHDLLPMVALFIPSPEPATVPSPPPALVLPETQEEVEVVVLGHLSASRWREVWGVWRGTRGLREGEGEEGADLSQAERDLGDLASVLDLYCKHLADTREGEWRIRK